jgi:transcriptional regulator with XRE-family HTH domain
MPTEKIKHQRVRSGAGIDSIPRVTLPEPSGHTESIPATLRTARAKLNLRQADVVALLKRDFDITVAESTVQAWEAGRNEPDIRTYSRWARCVGKRLVVQVLDADTNTQMIEVHPDLADAAQTIGELASAKAGAAQAIAEALKSMSAGEVKALAFDLARRSE